MRVAVLWSELSGYFDACLRELAGQGNELFVAHRGASREAPYDEGIFDWMENRYRWEAQADAGELLRRLECFAPDVILCANWHDRAYRKALGRFRGRAVRLFASDRPWRGSPRQWLGALVSRFYLRPLGEAMFVPGERQAVFAGKMGFRQENILRGMYSCDHEKFSEAHAVRALATAEPRSFVYVGRFCPEKGLDVLVRAYGLYRRASAEPWPLRCYGAGALGALLDGHEGVERMAFCQPDDLPAEFVQAGCLVLPSVFEPWGLVVHEAAAAGLAMIASDAVGAAVHLVQDGHNGYVVEAGDAEALARAMLRFASLGREERREMGENSRRMSFQFTPRRWAQTLSRRGGEMLARLRGAA